jgi:hypothetical protein
MGYEPVDLGHPDVNRAVNALRADLDVSPPSWWWLSFVDVSAAPHRFLGVAIVRATNEITAVREAHRLGCNPGGEVGTMRIPDEGVPPAGWRERLLSREEIAGLEALMAERQDGGEGE